MTIHNLDAFIAGLWDWAILDGCFGKTRIRPTDIDGMVERNGRFLILETKAPGAALPLGQGITLEALRKTGYFTIIIVWGEKNQPQSLIVMTKDRVTPKIPTDLHHLRRVVRWWFNEAERLK